MKKILLVIAILFMACSYSIGQHYSLLSNGNGQNTASDGFFTSTYEEYREENLEWGAMPLLPQTHGYMYDYTAVESVPVGSGLLVLGLLGVGYMARKKRDNE